MESPIRFGTESVEAIVHRIMIEEFEVDESLLRPDALLADDLGLDSLDGVDLVVALEKAFNYRISEEDARRVRTLRDVVERVTSRLKQGQAKSA